VRRNQKIRQGEGFCAIAQSAQQQQQQQQQQQEQQQHVIL
jgi:hypothetical protein